MADDDFDVAGVWRSFCARLGAAGDGLARAPFPTSGADRALCARHLTRQLVMALQSELEFGDAVSRRFIATKNPGCNGADRIPTTSTRGPRSTRPRRIG